jgi:signal transduction histidine kinase
MPGSATSEMLGSTPVRVLLIDDQRPIYAIVRKMLSVSGQGRFELAWADTLQDGILHLAEHGSDVVLLDLGLPDSSGVETVKRVHAARPGLPIVVVSGLDQQAVFLAAMRAGAQDYLVKDQLSGELLVRAILYARERKRDEDRLARSHEDMRRLTAHLQSIREQERTRIAREIHDQLGQSLTALKMDQARLSGIVARMPENDEKPLVLAKLEGMSGLIGDTIQTVRHISSELRPGALDDLGLVAAVEGELREFERRTGVRCRIETSPESFAVGEPAATQLFRVFQELVTNIVRHSGAQQVSVNLSLRSEVVLLEVFDDGRGIEQSQVEDPHSLGLLGMRERVGLAGGTIVFKGVPGEGTTVSVAMPVNASGP